MQGRDGIRRKPKNHYQFLHCDRSVKQCTQNFAGKFPHIFKEGAEKGKKGSSSSEERKAEKPRGDRKGEKNRKHKTALNDVRMGKSLVVRLVNQGQICKSHRVSCEKEKKSRHPKSNEIPSFNPRRLCVGDKNNNKKKDKNCKAFEVSSWPLQGQWTSMCSLKKREVVKVTQQE